MQRYLAIDNLCGWPTLTLLPDGTLCTLVFNQPCHGTWEGDVDCWVSRDGALWHKRGVAAAHAPGTNRMNVAVGLNARSELIALCSGWAARPAPGSSEPLPLREVLPVWVCRSSDQGRTWSHTESFPNSPNEGEQPPIPFGDIALDEEGRLFATAYCPHLGEPKAHSLYLFCSEDHGHHWRYLSTIGRANYNEASLLYLGGRRWLAAARTLSPADLVLFRSEDHGQTWEQTQRLSLPRQHPANLRRLSDGSLLLTYGNRCKNMSGLDLRRSDDEGETWKAPVRLLSLDAKDLGYPSTAQRADGSLVTVYYADQDRHHRRYHIGSVCWRLDELE
jgi:BNR repeat-like domain